MFLLNVAQWVGAVERETGLTVMFFYLLLPLANYGRGVGHSSSTFKNVDVSSIRHYTRSSLFDGAQCSHSLLQRTVTSTPSDLSCCCLLSFCSGSCFIATSFSSILCCGQLIGHFYGRIRVSTRIRSLLSAICGVRNGILVRHARPSSTVVSCGGTCRRELRKRRASCLPSLYVGLTSTGIRGKSCTCTTCCCHHTLFVYSSLKLPSHGGFPICCNLKRACVRLHSFRLSGRCCRLTKGFFPRVDISRG